MPGRLWREWQLYFQATPFGPRQEEVRAGMLAAILANQHRGKDGRAIGAEEFFPSLRVDRQQERRQRQSPEAEVAKMRSWVMACGGTIDGRPARPGPEKK